MEAQALVPTRPKAAQGSRRGVMFRDTVWGNTEKDLFCYSESTNLWLRKKPRILVGDPLLPQSLGALLA